MPVWILKLSPQITVQLTLHNLLSCDWESRSHCEFRPQDKTVDVGCCSQNDPSVVKNRERATFLSLNPSEPDLVLCCPLPDMVIAWFPNICHHFNPCCTLIGKIKSEIWSESLTRQWASLCIYIFEELTHCSRQLPIRGFAKLICNWQIRLKIMWRELGIKCKNFETKPWMGNIDRNQPCSLLVGFLKTKFVQYWTTEGKGEGVFAWEQWYIFVKYAIHCFSQRSIVYINKMFCFSYIFFLLYFTRCKATLASWAEMCFLFVRHGEHKHLSSVHIFMFPSIPALNPGNEEAHIPIFYLFICLCSLFLW